MLNLLCHCVMFIHELCTCSRTMWPIERIFYIKRLLHVPVSLLELFSMHFEDSKRQPYVPI